MHSIATVETTQTPEGMRVTRECSCGWLTFGAVPEPDHHTPLAHREADHLRQAAQIEDGSVWDEIPPGHGYALHLRRRLRTNEPNQVVITAVWLGGQREVLNWPWTAAGLAQAQDWCDRNLTHWGGDNLRTGRSVQPGELASHANAV